MIKMKNKIVKDKIRKSFEAIVNNKIYRINVDIYMIGKMVSKIEVEEFNISERDMNGWYYLYVYTNILRSDKDNTIGEVTWEVVNVYGHGFEAKSSLTRAIFIDKDGEIFA